MDNSQENVISIEGLKSYMGGQWVLNGIDLTIPKDKIFGIAGPSGAGKTTLLRCILSLIKPTSGTIRIFSTEVTHCPESELIKLRRRVGVTFQHNALFSSLTVLENVLFPLHELTHLSPSLQREIAFLKIMLTGLSLSDASKYPSELSGGMQKRAALARALALDPELLFLDEPTAGLDPRSADSLDDLILNLREALDLTIVIVTHDLDTLRQVSDQVAFLGNGKVLAKGTMIELTQNPHPLIKDYFSGPRGQIIINAEDFNKSIEH